MGIKKKTQQPPALVHKVLRLTIAYYSLLVLWLLAPVLSIIPFERDTLNLAIKIWWMVGGALFVIGMVMFVTNIKLFRETRTKRHIRYGALLSTGLFIVTWAYVLGRIA